MRIKQNSLQKLPEFDENLDSGSEKNKEICHICGKKFKNQNSCRVHIRNIHQKPKSNISKILKCPIPKCYFEATDQETISEHLMSHNHCIKCPKPKCNFEAKNQQALNYFYSHAFLFNSKSDLPSLTFK